LPSPSISSSFASSYDEVSNTDFSTDFWLSLAQDGPSSPTIESFAPAPLIAPTDLVALLGAQQQHHTSSPSLSAAAYLPEAAQNTNDVAGVPEPQVRHDDADAAAMEQQLMSLFNDLVQGIDADESMTTAPAWSSWTTSAAESMSVL